LEPPTNVGWSTFQIMNLAYPEPGTGGRQESLHRSQLGKGKRTSNLKVSFGSSDHVSE
jgi:hypothetical protein